MCESLASKTFFYAVVVHACEKDFAGASFLCFARPIEESLLGGNTATFYIAYPLTIVEASIDGYHAYLTAEVASNKVTFFSRTKQRLWTKGESSGNFLNVVSIEEDCDHDTLLIKVIPEGPVCHTGSATCFNNDNSYGVQFLSFLQDFIDKRHQEMPEGSYTTSLFNSGLNRIAQKVGEEALETVIEATNGTNGRLVYEASDMLYHLIVLLSEKGLRIEDLTQALYDRHNKKKEDYDKNCGL